MDDTKKTPGGQVINDSYEPQYSDMNPTGSPTGTPLAMQYVDGKSGSVTKLAMVQTDSTDGPGSQGAPEYEGPGDQADGSQNG